MPIFKLPLSGDVVQSINPYFMSPIGSQFGLINITLGQSSAPEVEQDVLSDVGTYGKQIGQIADALLVLVEHIPLHGLKQNEKDAIAAFRKLVHDVADVKERHHRRALRPRPDDVA